MFTGIIEDIGQILTIQPGIHSARITITASVILEDIHLGDSISVNGVCLTVTQFTADHFTADIMPETLRRSSLGQLHSGSPVNLERAMPANGRFGGHIVTGHIDGTGTITQIQREENAFWYTIQAAPELVDDIIEKGSVAIDGISLTVASVSNAAFRVSIIPHTAANTTLSTKRINDTVNLETDCIGKYIKKLLQPQKQSNTSNVTMDLLARSGFLEGSL